MQLSSLKKRLGDILVDVGIITPAQLKEALEIQKRSGGKLGTILSQMGALNEEVMLAFLGKQCGVSYISLNEYGDISPEVIRSVPESVVRHQMLVPIAKENNMLTVAMADPFNVFAVDDVKLMTGCDVQVVIASESEIKAAIEKYYSHIPEAQKQNNETVRTSSGQVSVSDDEIIGPLITEALEAKASDIHLEPNNRDIRIRYRIDGILYEKSSVTKELQERIALRLKAMGGLDTQKQHLPQEGRLNMRVHERDISIRISTLPTVFGEKLLLQLMTPMVFDLAKLGFDPEVLAIYKNNIENPNGLVLLTGPVDSGKTTTLYSTITALNHPDRNILTVEDQVGYILPGITQVQINPAVGFSFAAGLHAATRQNPDIIMLEEIGDRETAQLAIATVMTGHTVFSSLSTNDTTTETVLRLLATGIEPFMLTSALTMVVAQRLIRTVCPACKESYEITKSSLKGTGIAPQHLGDKEKIILWRGKGCPECANTGYNGRTGIFEVLSIDPALSALILKKAPEQSLRKTALKKGMMTLRESAWRKVRSGVSTIEEMLRIMKFSKF